MPTQNEGFWNLSKGAQVSMWMIGVMSAALLFLGGRESAHTEIESNVRAIEIHDIHIEQNAKDITEVEEIVKENQIEIKQELKEQRSLIQEIHTIVIENNGD